MRPLSVDFFDINDCFCLLINGFAGLLATARKQNEAIGRALEAVRQEWIRRQINDKPGDGGGSKGQQHEPT